MAFPASTSPFRDSPHANTLLLEEQIIRIGRRSAFERVAHMLLEFFHRLNAVE